MNIKKVSDVILLKDIKDVLRLRLYSKLLQFGIKPYESDLDILIILYQSGGYNGTEEQKEFIKKCIDLKLKKSDQSVRNVISKYTMLKVLDRPKNTIISFNETFLPNIICDKLVLESIISHKN